MHAPSSSVVHRSVAGTGSAHLCEVDIVLQPNSDLGVDLALESTQCFMTVFDTTWPTYSECGSCHSGTLGEIEIFKMAATNVKHITIAIASLLILTETYSLRLVILGLDPSHVRNMSQLHKMYGNPSGLPRWPPMTWKIPKWTCSSLFNAHINVCLCVLACMCCPPNNKIGDVSTANDVCKSKMAAKFATTNMTIIEITIKSFFNLLRNLLLVYTHVLSPRGYERIYLNDERYSQVQ